MNVDLNSNCPGFDLWMVTMKDGTTHEVQADSRSSSRTVAWYLGRENGTSTEVESVSHIGPNPRALYWKKMKNI